MGIVRAPSQYHPRFIYHTTRTLASEVVVDPMIIGSLEASARKRLA